MLRAAKARVEERLATLYAGKRAAVRGAGFEHLILLAALHFAWEGARKQLASCFHIMPRHSLLLPSISPLWRLPLSHQERVRSG